MKSLGNILITGGASGLGAATVQAVRDNGGTPLVLDRNSPSEPVEHALVDLADRESTEHAVKELARSAGDRIDGVFTAAGIDSCGSLDTVPAEEWERVIGVNLLGTVSVVRAALPYLHSSAGTAVMCSSTLGIKPTPDATAYCASKAGVLAFSRSLAAETSGRIGVTTLVPGGMHTAFFDGRDEQYQPPADAKLNQPEDVAETVLFALRQPPGCEVREMVVCSSEESSWP
ncbi:NADP-dependent 3-hydroxy acid dehydrogenase YdfG [Saccharopolyspora lacisalsi]|uniref:NADP-dependent 3-hydroxy acid dehydrogenase YdfG n=1 Tax=Halosaccharopolyspora lacisalsi TaxID=1000566 RepID=A0A839DZE1_9PSEU|nr:SDR family NAD(P)-dependent oxidoreductase [Halosaccharopolyspora lacisalsi]MBA8824857.1 NADP-dependent 3-hydroxy acid dehydrogenase YdfG [Halosaccharopolyspora lacisalsi]